MLRASGVLVGGGGMGTGLGTKGGGGSREVAKCSRALTVVRSSVTRIFSKYELPRSSENGMRNACSMAVEYPGMSVSKKPASINTDLRSGCGALAMAAEPSRLFEKPCSTAAFIAAVVAT